MKITANGNRSEFLCGNVVGVVTAVPTNEVDNDRWSDAVEAARLTGVQSRRHVTNEQTTETLCLAAARRLMANLGWDASEIDALIYVTQTPSDPMPSPGYGLHQSLGLAQRCPVVEVNWSCAGYVYGLWLAMKLAATDHMHEVQRVLVLVGDTTSQIVGLGDRATAPLFGDCGSATAVENGPLSGLSYFVLGSDGAGAPLLHQDHGGSLQMHGPSVFDFTLRKVPGLVQDVLDDGDPDFILFHQANKFMLDHLVKKCKLTDKNVPMNIDRFGNCSSASIPLLLCDQLGLNAAATRCALFGFGAGWSWAGAMVSMHGLQVAELIEVGT